MEHVIKFPRFNDLIKRTGGSEMDSAFVFNMLTQVDVRDAMSAAMASGNQTLWKHVVEHMRQEAIWRYWMERDLKIVFDYKRGDLPTWIDQRYVTDAPKWKVYYLWMRLIIGFLQWNLLRKKWPYFIEGYPPGSTLKYVTLNTIELSPTGDDFFKSKPILLDFRKEFKRISPRIMNQRYQAFLGSDYSLSSLLVVSDVNNSRLRLNADNDVVAFFMRYKMDIFEQGFSMYSGIFDFLIDWLKHDSTVGRFGTSIDQKTLQNPPRAIEYTRILLAGRIQCDGCGSHLPEMRCKRCETYFCDDKCAIKHRVH